VGGFLSAANPDLEGRVAVAASAESFIADLHTVWEKHGLAALEKCAVEEPGQFIRVLATLMPKNVNLSVALDPVDFASRFRSAREMLGNVEPPRLRRPLPNQPLVIERDDDG
jgi:hypothetical protein